MCIVTNCSRGQLTLCTQLSNEHRAVEYGMDRWVASGGPGRSQLGLVPPKARPELHSKRGLEIQNNTNTMHLGTQDHTPTFSSPYLCKQLNPPVSGRISREKNKIEYFMPINTALQRTMRKENIVHLFLKEAFSSFPFFLKENAPPWNH